MSLDPHNLPPEAITFMTDRHLASLTTIRSDGSPHVVPVGFSYDSNDGIARVITFEGSQKVVNARRGGRAALCQIDGAHWITLEGEITAVTDAERVERAVDGYSQRYRTPQDRPDRVALEIRIDRVLGRLP